VHKPLQIGITGGIGSGKSLVCKIFQVLNVPTYDADSRAKAVMTTDGILIAAIKKEFGKLSYQANGELNREYLAKKVFVNEKKLNLLNSLVHPRVLADYQNWLTMQIDTPYLIKEAALLFETGLHKALDKIIVVHAPEALRVKRVMLRDKHRTEGQVREIMSKQLKEEEKLKMADFVVRNDETNSVIDQVLMLHANLLELEKNGIEKNQ